MQRPRINRRGGAEESMQASAGRGLAPLSRKRTLRTDGVEPLPYATTALRNTALKKETVATLPGSFGSVHAIRLGIEPFAELGANSASLSGSEVESSGSRRTIRGPAGIVAPGRATLELRRWGPRRQPNRDTLRRSK